jgi:hypothetical protein
MTMPIPTKKRVSRCFWQDFCNASALRQGYFYFPCKVCQTGSGGEDSMSLLLAEFAAFDTT